MDTNVIKQTVAKLLESSKLIIASMSDDHITCTGQYLTREIEFHVSIMRPSLSQLATSMDKNYLHMSVTAKVDGAKAYSTDYYNADDIEFIRDQLNALIETANKSTISREDAFQFLTK